MEHQVIMNLEASWSGFCIDWVLNGSGEAQHVMHDECNISVPKHERDERA